MLRFNHLHRAEVFENEVLFLRLDLPSKLICHENGASFRKLSSNRRSVGGKHLMRFRRVVDGSLE